MIELPSQYKLKMTSDTERVSDKDIENNAKRPLAQALICDSADDDLCESLIAGIVTRCRLECDPDQPIREQYLAELTNQSPANIPGVTYLMRDTFLVFSPRPLSWPRSLTRSVWDNFRESARESKLVRNDAQHSTSQTCPVSNNPGCEKKEVRHFLIAFYYQHLRHDTEKQRDQLSNFIEAIDL